MWELVNPLARAANVFLAIVNSLPDALRNLLYLAIGLFIASRIITIGWSVR